MTNSAFDAQFSGKRWRRIIVAEQNQPNWQHAQAIESGVMVGLYQRHSRQMDNRHWKARGPNVHRAKRFDRQPSGQDRCR